MSWLHNLHASLYVSKPGESVWSRKVLGVTISEGMSWNEYITKSIGSAYLSLKSLRQLTPYHVRKNIVKVLVLSSLDYENTFFYNISKYLQNQKQTDTDSFVHRKYAKKANVLSLN